MKTYDIFVFASIAIVYNIFVHNLASITYEDLQYKDKQDNTIIMILIMGIFSIVISKILSQNKKYNNKYVRNGLYYGGLLLILTVLFTNWADIGPELRLVGIGAILGGLILYGYKIDNNKD